MAWPSSPLNAGNTGSAATSPVTKAFTPTAGNLVLVYVADFTTASASFTVVLTNSGGSTIATATQLVQQGRTGQSLTCAIYGVIAPSGTANVKVTASTDSIAFYYEEWSGNPSTILTDGSGTGQGASATTGAISASFTTKGATDLIVGMSGQVSNNGGALGWSTPTLTLTAPGLTLSALFFQGYGVQSSTGTFTPAATWSTARQWVTMAVALVPAYPATGASTATLTGAAVGAVTIAATASSLATLSGAAVGTVGIASTASATATLTGTATGAVSIAASASGLATLTSIAVGTVTIAATASATATLTGTAVGVITGATPGTGSSLAILTGTAVGALAARASSTATLTGAAVGQLNLRESAASTATLTGTAHGIIQGAGKVQVAEVSNFSSGAAVRNFSSLGNVQNFQQS